MKSLRWILLGLAALVSCGPAVDEDECMRECMAQIGQPENCEKRCCEDCGDAEN